MKKTLLTKGHKRLCYPPKAIFVFPHKSVTDNLKRKPFFHLPTIYVGHARFGFVQHLKLVEDTEISIYHHRSGRAFSITFCDTHLVEKALLWAKTKYCVGVRKVINPNCGNNPLLLPEGYSFYKIILKVPELNALHTNIFLAKDVTVLSTLGELETCEVFIQAPPPIFWMSIPESDGLRRIDFDDKSKQFEIIEPFAGKIFANPRTTTIDTPNANGRIYGENFSEFLSSSANSQLVDRLKRGPLTESLEHPTP